MCSRLGALGLAAAFTLATAPQALAHAYLAKASPEAGSTVKTTPRMLLLTFTEDLNVPFCQVAVTDAMGANDATGKPEAVPGHANEMQVPLNIQMPGKITVIWHALSVDTHKTQGSFYFTVSG